MKLLAIDTSENGCTAALHIDGEVLERFELAPRKHTDLIIPMIDELMSDSGLSVVQLDALAYGRGPGSFTGIRVGAGVIQGIAIAADLPVVAVSTLRALAQGAYRQHSVGKVLPAFDARMQEVYWGVYEIDSDNIMQSLENDIVTAPANVELPEGDDWFAVGSGWAEYPVLMDLAKGKLSGTDDRALVHAGDVAELAVVDFQQGNALPAEQAVPVYLRDNVAKKKKEQKASV